MATSNPSSRTAPQITVLMPVCNGERYVGAAIESMLGQTFGDFELLIIDDGSSDASLSIVRDYAARDQRIRVVSKRQNQGLIATLNEGIDLARGAYLARMDCDDLSLPERLQKQYDFMRAHPDHILCGSNSLIINARGQLLKKWSVAIATPDDFQSFCSFSTPFVHSSAFICVNLLRDGNFYYDDGSAHAEDFELWGRLSMRHPCAVLDDFLVVWRDHRLGICRSHRDKQMIRIVKIVERNLSDRWFDVPRGTYLNLINEDRELTAQDIEKAASASNEVLTLAEQLPAKTRDCTVAAFSTFINRLIVELAYSRTLDAARDFHKRLSRAGKWGLRSRLLMALPSWLPDALSFQIESAADYAYQKIWPLVRGGGGGGGRKIIKSVPPPQGL